MFSRFILAVIISVATGNLIAQETSANSLNQIAGKFLGNWIGYGLSPEGEKYTSKLTFEWTLNKNFIRMNNFLTAEGQTELYALTIYGWQPVLQTVVFWSFDNSGTINEGVAKMEGNTLGHEWRAFSQNGEIRELRSTIVRENEGQITFTLYDGSEPEPFTIIYKREK